MNINKSVRNIESMDLEKLIEEARNSKNRRSRINIHDSPQSSSQKMIIALFNDSIVDMHRHPINKSESYFPLIGSLEVTYLLENVESKVVYEPSPSPLDGFNFVTHANGMWHQPKALGEFCVYLEIYDGPYNKEIDVEYYV